MLNRSSPWNRLPNRPTLSSLVDGGWVWTASHPGQLAGARLLTSTSTTGASIVGSSLGPAFKFSDVANAGISFGQVQPIDNPPITLLLVAQLTARTTYRAVVDQRLGSGAFNSTSIRSNYRTVAKANNSGTLGLYFETGGSFSADSQIDGALHAWVFRKNGFGVGTAAMWRDGVAQTLGEDSGTGSNPNASTEQFRIGNHGDYSGTGFANPDPVLMFLCVPRALSDEACRTLSKQPLLAFSSQRIWVPVSVSAAGDVTAALAGSAVAASAGTLAPSLTVALTGSASTSSAGTLTPALSLPLSGSAVTASAGTVVPNTSIALTGTAVTVSAGTVANGNDVAVSLTGQAVTSSVGALGVSLTVSLSGASSSASAGALTPLDPNVTVSLSGTDVTASAGTISPEGGSSLLGRRGRRTKTKFLPPAEPEVQEAPKETPGLVSEEAMTLLIQEQAGKAIRKARVSATKRRLEIQSHNVKALESTLMEWF